MEYRISNIKVSVKIGDQEKKIINKIAAIIPRGIEIISIKIWKRSIDARDKEDILYVYTVDFITDKAIKNYSRYKLDLPSAYQYPDVKEGPLKLNTRPVVCGFGPSGIFAALVLAERGYRPIVIERGKMISERKKDVERFWSEGILYPESNVQFGEGGAGTFSDGKLTTQTKNPRSRRVLETFVEHGAPDEILFESKPHIGTDLLRNVISNIREKIVELGGEIHFQSKLEDIIFDDNHNIKNIIINGKELATEVLILALGNSSRDTFELLRKKGVSMTVKPFAVGLRIEHLQDEVNRVQYGSFREYLGAADYKLTYNGKNRSAYTFCMCPGGEVINGASEPDSVVTNGMSYHSRSGINSNSAILVNVVPDDFTGDEVLAGMDFQRSLEKMAFKLGGSDYSAPVQLVGDFLANRKTEKLFSVKPSFRPGYKFVNFNEHLPQFLLEGLHEGLKDFAKRMSVFANEDAVLTGIETRSSSPVRILRDKGESINVKGLFPAGEGAGYAGGIMSAAVDGICSAEEVIRRYYYQ